MPCLLGVIAAFFPRVIIILLMLFSSYISSPFGGKLLLPILGLIFLPFTLLLYCVVRNEHGAVEGVWWIPVVLGLLLDFGVIGGGAKAKGRVRVSRKE